MTTTEQPAYLTPLLHNILGVPIKCVSWTMDVNEHLVCYGVPSVYYKDDEYFELLDLTNTVYYRVTIYANSPAGFYSIVSDSEVGMRKLLEIHAKENN